MLDSDLDIAGTKILGGNNIVTLLEGHGLGAGDTGDRGPGEQTQNADQCCHAGFEEGVQNDHQQHGGQRQEDIGKAHEQHIQLAADIAREDADGGADTDGDQHGREADQQRDAAAVEGTGEVVTAEFVTAKEMLQRGLGKLICTAQAVGIVGAQRGQQAGCNDDGQIDDGQDGHFVGLDLFLDILPNAAMVDGTKILGLFLQTLEGVLVKYNFIFHLLRLLLS